MQDRGFWRDWGILCGHELMKLCAKMAVFIIDEEVSAGMQDDINYATRTLGLQPDLVHMSREAAEQFIQDHLRALESER